MCVSAGCQESIGRSGCSGPGRHDASQHRRYKSHRWVSKSFANEYLTSVCLDSVVCSSPALAALAGSQLRTANANRAQQQQHEMTVSNDLIGCIIGKGGTKIAEIRQISGAMIRISNCEEREGGNTDRTITISGNPDSVALAQYLINMRWVLAPPRKRDYNLSNHFAMCIYCISSVCIYVCMSCLSLWVCVCVCDVLTNFVELICKLTK